MPRDDDRKQTAPRRRRLYAARARQGRALANFVRATLLESLNDISDMSTVTVRRLLEPDVDYDHGGPNETARGMTREEVGAVLGCHRERVRQIEAKALRKLRHPSRSHMLVEFLPDDLREALEQRAAREEAAYAKWLAEKEEEAYQVARRRVEKYQEDRRRGWLK